jgi:hypothetical protein
MLSRLPLVDRRRMNRLVLKSAFASRPFGEWSDDDYDVLADGVVVGRIMQAAAKCPIASKYRISDAREEICACVR